MTQAMQHEFSLFGYYAGATMDINGHIFVNGSCAILVQPENLGFLVNYFRKYGGFLKGTPEYDEAFAEQEKRNGDRVEAKPSTGNRSPEEVQSNAGPTGGGAAEAESILSPGHANSEEGDASIRSKGNGHEDPGLPVEPEVKDKGEPAFPVNMRLRKAVMALDSQKPMHWTAAGLPAMLAVEQAYGDTGFTRADVNAAAPDWDREKAAELKDL